MKRAKLHFSVAGETFPGIQGHSGAIQQQLSVSFLRLESNHVSHKKGKSQTFPLKAQSEGGCWMKEEKSERDICYFEKWGENWKEQSNITIF